MFQAINWILYRSLISRNLQPQPVLRGGEVGGCGSGEISEEGGYRGGGTLQKSISVKHFHNTQEEWKEKASGRHEGPKQLPRISSFQNGRSFIPAINPPEEGFMCKIDLQDAYETIPIVKVPAHMSTFWPQILSKNFHKGSESPLGLPQRSGSLFAGVFRRTYCTYHGSNPRAMSGAYPADMAVVDRFRFSGKTKVSFNSQAAGRIPCVPHEFHQNKTVFNGRKTVTVPASGKLTHSAGRLAAGLRLNAGSTAGRKLSLLREFSTFVLHYCL